MSSVNSLLARFSIKMRMRGAIVMVLALFALVGAVAYGGGTILKHLNTDFMEHSVKELDGVGEVVGALDAMRLVERDMVIGYEANNRNYAQNRKAWEDQKARFVAGLNAMMEGEEDEDNVVAREALKQMEAYEQAAIKVFKGMEGNAYDTGGAVVSVMRNATSHADAARESLRKIHDIVTAEAKETQAEFSAIMDRIGMAFAAVMVLVVAVVVPLTLMNSASITQPIDYARTVAQSIAEGDLTQNISVTGNDEAGQMLEALREMQVSLRRMVAELRESSQTIHQASSEVAQGNHDLSQRTEQSAANLQQTASSIEELTQTVRQSADSAQTANQLASSAAQVARRGGEVVSEVVSTMDEILGSSRKIADIIGTIDGIAFQTNILALNAAVEAARAGEQGRGFAVVAGEVRALAQRSASAAREIKTLIGTSVGSVENGSRLVQNAGKTMEEIVSSVQKVTDIIGEISSAAREQSQGIGQVNSAVSDLDRMTQQNAALVEESAAAATNLGEQASRLNQVVQRFRVTP
jgi:methyl-accepting chemotaxis protein